MNKNGSKQLYHSLALNVFIALLASSTQLAQASNYNFNWVGNGPNPTFTSSDSVSQVNNAGQVLGYRFDASIKDTGFGFKRTSGMFNGTTFTPHVGTTGASTTLAVNMNEASQATGFYYLDSEDIRPTRWVGTSTVTELPRLNGFHGEGADINNSGQIAGFSWADTNFHAVRWDADNTIHDLPTLGGTFGRGSGINDLGYVVGSSFTDNDTAQHAALWKPDGSVIDLDTSGSSSSWAEKINNRGQVVGFTTNENGLWDVTLWNVDGSAPIDLTASLGADVDTAFEQGRSTLINNAGQVVFDAFNADGSQNSYLWSNGNLLDIGTLLPSGVSLLTVTGINDKGELYGRAMDKGAFGGFVLTPTTVPIPGAVWLLGSALMGLLGVKRR